MSGTMWEFQKKQVPIVLKWNGFQGLIIGGTKPYPRLRHKMWA